MFLPIYFTTVITQLTLDPHQQSLPARKYLHLGGCNGVGLTAKGLTKAFKNFGAKLLSLSLSNEIVVMENKTDEEFQSQWPLMYNIINDDVMIEIIKSCPNLTAIDISFCKITDRFVTSLIFIYLFPFSHIFFNALNRSIRELSNCKKLETFVAKYNLNISETTLSNLLSNLPNLKHLNLRAQRGTMSHFKVTPTVLSSITSRNITHLILTRCVRGDDRALVAYVLSSSN